MRVIVTHNIGEGVARLNRLSADVLRAADAGMARGAVEIAREARDKAPKNSSELTNRIGSRRVGLLAHDVNADAEHASYVEEGTRPGGRPSLPTTLEWMARAGITPQTPGMSRRSLASLIRLRIAQRGIEAQPFMQPALRAKSSRLVELIRQGIAREAAR